MWKDVKAILLPTNKKVYDTYMVDNLEFHTDKKLSYNGIEQQLYIISLDEEIKLGDYYIDDNGLFGPYEKGDIAIGKFNKVIATTDKSLIIKSQAALGGITIFPQISQQFIEEWIAEYNKGVKIEDLEVEYELDMSLEEDAIKFPILKISKDNFISIRRKDKRVYSKQEVVDLIIQFRNEILIEVQKGHVSNFTDNWIKKNL